MAGRTATLLTPASRLVLATPKALFLATFLASIGGIVVSSFIAGDGSFSLAVYAQVLGSTVMQDVILRTVVVAAKTTFFALLLGYPVALFIARAQHRNLMLILVISPWLISIIVRTFGWIVILGNRGVLNKSLMGLGLTDAPIRILFTSLGTVIGLVHVLLPFMVISILSILMQHDRRLTEAGMSLGAGPVETFARVTLPLSLPGVLSGCSLVYLVASGAIVTPLLLGGLRDRMIGTQIFQEIFALYNFPRASAMAVILLISSLLIIAPLQVVEARVRRWTQG
jgi:putative spermidine/putrescine transport system permease protein